jgi:hypothetical protein
MLYGETTPEESFMLNEIIEHNVVLKNEVSQMRQTIQEFNTPLSEPDAAVVQNILRYNSDKALEFSA